jgi:hypothetical protein
MRYAIAENLASAQSCPTVAHVGTNLFLGLVLRLRINITMSTVDLTYETWKFRFRQDCQLQDKMLAYNSFGEDCLKLLWETGTEPSVQGIIDGGAKAA